jgi:hypothetical protein
MIKSTTASRHNTGKPELSYLIDFANALETMTDTDGCENVIHTLSQQDYGTVAYELLGILQRDLCGTPWVVNNRTITELLSRFSIALDELCLVASNGAIKYDRDNWKKGFPEYVLLDSAIRHYQKFLMGKKRDELDDSMRIRWDCGEFSELFEDFEEFETRFATHHIAHALWNIMVLIEQRAS